MSKTKTLLYTLFVMLLWGSLFPTVKMGYTLYKVVTVGDILFFAGVRFTICGAIICLYTLISDRKSFKLSCSSMMSVLASGLFSIILHYGFTYSALTLTDSSKTAILKQVGLLFYIGLSSLFFKSDKLTFKKLMGAIMGFLGIVAININTNGISFNIGDMLIILASFCTVFSNIISKKVFAKVKPITSTGISQLFGGICLLVIGSLLGGDIKLSSDLTIFIFIYICVASIVSYTMWFNVVKKGELSNLFIIKFTEPIFACIFGALILGENIFRIQYIIAFLLISGGIYISQK